MTPTPTELQIAKSRLYALVDKKQCICTEIVELLEHVESLRAKVREINQDIRTTEIYAAKLAGVHKGE